MFLLSLSQMQFLLHEMWSIRTVRTDANQELHPDDQDAGDAEDLLDATADAVDDADEEDEDQAAEQVESEAINKKRESWQRLWYFSQSQTERHDGKLHTQCFALRIFWWKSSPSPGRKPCTTACSLSLSCWLWTALSSSRPRHTLPPCLQRGQGQVHEYSNPAEILIFVYVAT